MEEISLIHSPVAAEILRETRRSKNMTLKELALRTEISDGYLSLLERVQRPISKKNFVKIFEAGFGYELSKIENLWSKITEKENNQRSVAFKTLASSKYRVRNLGFNHDVDHDTNEESLWTGARWTANGRINYWKFYENSLNHIEQKNPLTSESFYPNWKDILDDLGKNETSALIEAVYSEMLKLEDEAEKDRYKKIIDLALLSIEDIKDALESMPEENMPTRQYASEVKPEDLPF